MFITFLSPPQGQRCNVTGEQFLTLYAQGKASSEKKLRRNQINLKIREIAISVALLNASPKHALESTVVIKILTNMQQV